MIPSVSLLQVKIDSLRYGNVVRSGWVSGKAGKREETRDAGDEKQDK